MRNFRTLGAERVDDAAHRPRKRVTPARASLATAAAFLVIGGPLVAQGSASASDAAVESALAAHAPQTVTVTRTVPGPTTTRTVIETRTATATVHVTETVIETETVEAAAVEPVPLVGDYDSSDSSGSGGAGSSGAGSSGGGGVYFANCTEAREAGAAPILRHEPGYRRALDRDNDGIACE